MSDLPIKKNVARTLYIPGLVSQADTKLFKTNPTIVAGDFKYSLDGGAWTNLATLPDVYPAGGTQVRLQFAQAELNCDQLNIRWADAAGAEWCDGSLVILTASLQTADAPTNSAGITTILADYARRTGDYSVLTAALVWNALTSGLTTVGSIGKLLVTNIDQKISEVDVDLGAGSVSTPITIDDGANPLDGVDVWATTDVGGANVVARASTNASGLVTFLLDPGTYYIWKTLSGYTFTNPSTLVVT